MKTENRKNIDKRQREGDTDCHHPIEKEGLFKETYNPDNIQGLNAFEYFEGHKYMTKIYEEAGLNVSGNDIKDQKVDSYLLFHKHIWEKKKFDLIDLDPYGLPFRFFPDIYLLMNNNCYLYVTAVKYHVPILSWRRKMKFRGYFQKEKPTYDDYIEFIKLMGECHGFEVEYLGGVSLNKNIGRFAFYCKYKKHK